MPALMLMAMVLLLLLLLLLIPLRSAALSFRAAAPLRHVAAVAVRVSSSAEERLSRPVLTADVTRPRLAPAVSAASAHTVATSAAADASTVPILLSPAPAAGLSSHTDTMPATAAASCATDTAACACAKCSRSSSLRLLRRLPVTGTLSRKNPRSIAFMFPMSSQVGWASLCLRCPELGFPLATTPHVWLNNWLLPPSEGAVSRFFSSSSSPFPSPSPSPSPLVSFGSQSSGDDPRLLGESIWKRSEEEGLHVRERNSIACSGITGTSAGLQHLERRDFSLQRIAAFCASIGALSATWQDIEWHL
uniref:Uncharacterized protein n=1 Tax=Arundo donax TaxID=35708 RepID=A0A0A9C8E4_ARUDO